MAEKPKPHPHHKWDLHLEMAAKDGACDDGDDNDDAIDDDNDGDDDDIDDDDDNDDDDGVDDDKVMMTMTIDDAVLPKPKFLNSCSCHNPIAERPKPHPVAVLKNSLTCLAQQVLWNLGKSHNSWW